jgi:hypothetical protein
MSIVLHLLAICRIKAKLKSGEMYVRGDQWPIFLYDDNQFDPENPWKGLLRNQLLVLVSCTLMLLMHADTITCIHRHTSMCLHH